MGIRSHARVVISPEEVVQNIATYMRSVAEHSDLADRIKQHQAWYAAKDRHGRWMFGPSKFVGYHQTNAKDYLTSYGRGSRNDGKETEAVLSNWFEQVDKDTALGRELYGEFVRFAEKFGKAPNSRWRVSVMQEELVTRGLPGHRRPEADVADRISYDPEICGGRPRIAGTRVRVSDIVNALAEGASKEEILEDYPYLSAEDISAALNYAAKAVDHRILKAA